MLPTNLPALLRAEGLTVVEMAGWKTRGRPGAFNPRGSLNHHTGASAKGWNKTRRLAYAKWMFVTGRSDLPAPLCQISLDPSGVVYVGARGRANHAGEAVQHGTIAAGDGNATYVGIEWMLSGSETIPAVMRSAGVKVNAVLLKEMGTTQRNVAAHYETSTTGKWDIGDPKGVKYKDKKVLDMDAFRSDVATYSKANTGTDDKGEVTVKGTKVQHALQDLRDAERINTARIAKMKPSPQRKALRKRVAQINKAIKNLEAINKKGGSL